MLDKGKIVAIIQARMGSSRLPGKILMDINSRSMLERVVERTRRSKLIDEIVIATTTDRADDKTVELASVLGVQVFRGSETNVLERYYQAAVQYKADHIVRITSDCPLIDPQIIDKVIIEHLTNNADYTSNTLKRTYPRGFDVEVFKFSSFKKVKLLAENEYQKEHVTLYYHQNPDVFNLIDVAENDGPQRPDLRLCVDEVNDLKLVRIIYDRLGSDGNFTSSDIINLFEREPELSSINGDVEQKTK